MTEDIIAVTTIGYLLMGGYLYLVFTFFVIILKECLLISGK